MIDMSLLIVIPVAMDKLYPSTLNDSIMISIDTFHVHELFQ